MILAPSRLQPSSGSRSLFLVLLALLLLNSCEALRPAQTGPAAPKPDKKQQTQPEPKDKYLEEIRGTRVYDPVKQEWVIIASGPKEKLDTVIWKSPAYGTVVINNEKVGAYPPAVRPAAVPKPVPSGAFTPRIEKKAQYNVSVTLPFLTGQPATAEENADKQVAQWTLNFYTGMKMAFEVLKTEGVNLNVSVRDTKANAQEMSRLLDTPEMRSADLIIGPYRRDNIRLAADFALKNNIALLSPYSAVSNLTSANPNYIQANPSLESHCRALLRNARREFAPEDIILVARNDVAAEKTCLQYLQKAHYELTGSDQAPPLEEYLITNPTYAGINVSTYMRNRDQVVFIVPSWADPGFVYFFLRKVSEARLPDQQVIVYGMPQWMEYENIEYEYYEKLNVRVSSNFFIDPMSEEIRDFQRKYFDTYGTVPLQEAYQGYDLMLYCGRMLNEYGKYFQYYLDVSPAQYLHTRFEFAGILPPTATTAERPSTVDRYENTFVNILEFRNFQFQALK